MKKIILDTNFLLIPGSLKIDIFSEIQKLMNEPYEIYIIDRSLEELMSIMKNQKGKHRNSAMIALKLIEEKKIDILSTEKQKSLYMNMNSKELIVDDIIAEIADENTIIATQDKGLKKRLKEKNIKLIILRNKKYLELD